MSLKSFASLKSAAYNPVTVRLIAFVLMLVLFILGAGAPGSMGGLGGG